jgi:signal transduction histidine kinase
MRERAEKLKGELLIRSRPGEGTEIRLAVPVGEGVGV